MTPLDIITVQQAKDFLKVDFDDDDLIIEGLISGAIGFIEQETQYRLYNRQEVIYTSKILYEAFQFPLMGSSVISQDSADTNTYTIRARPQTLRTVLFWGNGFEYVDSYQQFWNNDYYNISNPCSVTFSLSLNVGYTAVADVPQDLITAVKQIITYTYENRDMTKEEILNNIDMLIAPYRRFVTFI